jgi:hypothetical protein
MDTIKSVEQNYKWIIYRLCCESHQNKYEIINTETADQNILDSDEEKHQKVELIIVTQYLPEWQIVSPAIVKS